MKSRDTFSQFFLLIRFSLLFLLTPISLSQPLYQDVNYDTVKAQPMDNGKMWTFDFPPDQYFKDEYNFAPGNSWYEDVRLSSLKFGGGCSASFISEDGLIITNYHCSDNLVTALQKEGEDLVKDGFIAENQEDERAHPKLSVDQLLYFSDVTKDITDAFNSGKSTEEKASLRTKKIKELEFAGGDKSIVKKVVSYYNGGRYSLYVYKRYSDIRLVLAPEFQTGMFGGDPDNYTYPRYSLDFTLWRAYENGKPLKTKNFFKWSKGMPSAEEPIFVIGNPGRTNKQKTVSQLEYMRDYTYKYFTVMYTELQDVYEEMMNKYPDKFNEYSLRFSGTANGTKRFAGVLRGLRNPYYMARKKDFEKQFSAGVNADNELKEKYGALWERIKEMRIEAGKLADDKYGLTRNTIVSAYFKAATDLYKHALQMKLPEDKRESGYKGEKLDSTVKAIFSSKFDIPLEIRKFRVNEKIMRMAYGNDHEYVKSLFGGKTGNEAADYLYSRMKIKSREDVDQLIEDGPDAIIKSDDPVLSFIRMTYDRYNEITKLEKEIIETETVYEEQLGQALYAVYGTSIPPDGSGTIRIGDGVLKSYNYNGTIAPLWTTFYGMYDRHYSFNKKFPWNLPARWEKKPEGLDLETPFTFISTHDIVGGSSGSPVINIEKEFVGIAFDGNIESNAGYFIFDSEENRMISMSAAGILEAIKDVYQSKRIADEIINGKMK